MGRTTDTTVNKQLGNGPLDKTVACLEPEAARPSTTSGLTPADFSRVPSFRSLGSNGESRVTPPTTEQRQTQTRRKSGHAYTIAIGLAVVAGLTVATVAMRDTLQARATTEVVEGFRQDLRRWAGKEGWSNSWTFKSDGFVIPRELAIDIQSVPLADYRMEFTAQVERKGVGFVYRAMDFDNYYAARIIVANNGSIPETILERYAVIDGQAGPKTQVRLPFPINPDTLYHVEVEAAGEHFVTRINDQLVDAFSDSRLPTGGAGFFAGPDESARIYQLHLSAHAGLLGKVCSLLATLS